MRLTCTRSRIHRAPAAVCVRACVVWQKGVALAWNRGNVWKATVRLPKRTHFECKFVLVDDSGAPVRWEEGANEALDTEDDAVVLRRMWHDDATRPHRVVKQRAVAALVRPPSVPKPAVACDRERLAGIARASLEAKGFLSDFDEGHNAAAAEVVASLEAAMGEGRRLTAVPAGYKDLRHLPWCSIDNDDTRDIDQLTCCVEEPSGRVTVMVAVADVDYAVAKASPLDARALHNTTTLYPAGTVFPMLPRALCYDATSLNAGEDRRAFVMTSVYAHGRSTHQSTHAEVYA